MKISPRFHHHSEPAYADEHGLKGGRWVVVRGVQRWVPDPRRTPVTNDDDDPRPPVPDNCIDCDRDLSNRMHGGRGLCRPCYRKHKRAGNIEQFPHYRNFRKPQAAPPPPPEAPALADGVACPACGAGVTERCRTASGRPAKTNHGDRVIPRRCPDCMGDLEPGKKNCAGCRMRYYCSRCGDQLTGRRARCESCYPVTRFDIAVVRRILNGDWQLPASRRERLAVIAAWDGSLSQLERRTGWNVGRDLRLQREGLVMREDDVA